MDRNGHTPSSWLSASLWGQRSLFPTLQETLSAHGGAAPGARRGPQPCPHGAGRAAVVRRETPKRAQSALIPGALERPGCLASCWQPRPRASRCRLPHHAAGWHRLLMHLPVYIPPTKSSFVYGKELFSFHIFSLDSSSSQAERSLLPWGAERVTEPISSSLGRVPQAPSGGDPGQGTGAQGRLLPRGL